MATRKSEIKESGRKQNGSTNSDSFWAHDIMAAWKKIGPIPFSFEKPLIWVYQKWRKHMKEEGEEEKALSEGYLTNHNVATSDQKKR